MMIKGYYSAIVMILIVYGLSYEVEHFCNLGNPVRIHTTKARQFGLVTLFSSVVPCLMMIHDS